MTFFLNQAPVAPIKARGADDVLPSYWEGLGASVTAGAIERDSNGYTLLVREDVERSLIERAASVYQGETPLDLSERSNPLARRRALEALQADAAARPEAYEGIDLTPEGIDAAAQKQLEQEYRDAQDMIALSEPGISAPLIGGVLSGGLDVRNLALMAGGAGGASRTLLSVAGREAALNVAAEALTLPSQFEMAERLQIEDPSVIATLRDAALIGAAFGAGGELVARGLTYFRGTRGREEGVLHPADEQALVDRGETALLTSEDPVADLVAATREALGERRAEAVEARPPLIESSAPRQESSVEGQKPQVGSEFDPDPEAVSVYETLKSALDRDYPQLRSSRSVQAMIRERGGIAWSRMTPDGRKERTWAGQELEARGITQKQALSVLRKDGHQDLDNLDGDEDMAALFGRDDTGNYLNREAIIDALAREITSRKPEPTSASMRARMDEVEDARLNANSPRRTPAQDFVEGKRAPGGFYVEPFRGDPFGDDFDAYAGALGRDLDAYVERTWVGRTLSPQDKMQITSELSSRGGDAEYLVERMIERAVDFADAPKETIYEPIPGWDDVAPTNAAAPRAGGEGAGRPEQAAGAARGGEEGDLLAPLVSERTAAGDQLLAPGVAPISQRERLEALMSKPLGRAAKAADEGLFDLGARSQMDWLDEPAGKAADPIQQQRTADLRRLSEAEDREIVLPDGTKTRLSAALDDLDDLDEFNAVLDQCGTGRRQNDA